MPCHVFVNQPSDIEQVTCFKDIKLCMRIPLCIGNIGNIGNNCVHWKPIYVVLCHWLQPDIVLITLLTALDTVTLRHQ